MSDSRPYNPPASLRLRRLSVNVPRVLSVGGILLLTVLFTLPQLPSLQIQERDSGVFAYTGSLIVRGATPYADSWDHKTPVTYYLNAAAFILFGHTRWAIWFLETGVIFGAGLVIWLLVYEVYQQPALALFGASMFLLLAHHPLLALDTNFTETHALLWQSSLFFVGFKFLTQPGRRVIFLAGVLSGLLFLTKQNVIGTALSFGFVLLVHRVGLSQRWYNRFVWLFLGFALPIMLLSVYLYLAGSLEIAIEAIFVASPALSQWFDDGLHPLWETVGRSLRDPNVRVVFFPFLPLFSIALLSIAIRCFARNASTPVNIFERWVLLAFIADLVLSNTSGRNYSHYYITPALPYALITTMAVRDLPGALSRIRIHRFSAYLLLSAYLVTVGLLIWWLPLYSFMKRELESGKKLNGPELEHDLVPYIRANSTAEDTVLVWGASTLINFQAQRRSPTRYSYAYPLVAPTYSTENDIYDFVQELEFQKPRLIVDTTVVDGFRVPPLDPQARQRWTEAGGRQDVQDLSLLYIFVEKHCAIRHEHQDIKVYQCTYPP